MPLHVWIDYLEVLVWFVVVNELAVHVLVATSFIACSVRKIFPHLHEPTLRHSRPVYFSTMELTNEKSTNAIVTSEGCILTENPKTSTRSATDGDITDISKIFDCRVHCSWSTTNPVGTRKAGSRKIHRRQRRSKNLYNTILLHLDEEFLNEPDHLPKMIVIVRGTESSALEK